MKKENYAAAGNDFIEISKEIKTGEKYYTETKLYHALCLLETDKRRFQEIFNSMEDNSWAKNELNKILN